GQARSECDLPGAAAPDPDGRALTGTGHGGRPGRRAARRRAAGRAASSARPARPALPRAPASPHGGPAALVRRDQPRPRPPPRQHRPDTGALPREAPGHTGARALLRSADTMTMD